MTSESAYERFHNKFPTGRVTYGLRQPKFIPLLLVGFLLHMGYSRVAHHSTKTLRGQLPIYIFPENSRGFSAITTSYGFLAFSHQSRFSRALPSVTAFPRFAISYGLPALCHQLRFSRDYHQLRFSRALTPVTVFPHFATSYGFPALCHQLRFSRALPSVSCVIGPLHSLSP